MSHLGELTNLRETLKLSIELNNRQSNYYTKSNSTSTKNPGGVRVKSENVKVDDEVLEMEALKNFLNFKASLIFPQPSPSTNATTPPLNLSLKDHPKPKPKHKKKIKEQKENCKLMKSPAAYELKLKSPDEYQICNFSFDLSGLFDVDDDQSNNAGPADVVPVVPVVQPINLAEKPKINTTTTTEKTKTTTTLVQRKIQVQEGTGKLIHDAPQATRLSAPALTKQVVVQNQKETPYQIFEKHMKNKSASEKPPSTTDIAGRKRSSKKTGLESILAKPKKPRRSESNYSLYNPMLPYPANGSFSANNQAVRNANNKVINSLFGDARFPKTNIANFNTVPGPMIVSQGVQDLAPPWLKPKSGSKKNPPALQALYEQHKLRHSNANNKPVVLESMKDLKNQLSSRNNQPKVRGPSNHDPFPSNIPEHLLQPRIDNGDPEMHQFKTMFLPYQKQHLAGAEGPNLETYF